MPLRDDVQELTEGSFPVNANCDVGTLSTSQQPPGTFCMRVNDASKQVDAEDLSGADSIVTAFESFCIDESCMLKDGEAKEIMKADVVVESPVMGDEKRKDTLEGNDAIELSIMKDDGGKDAIVATDVCDVASSSPWKRSSRKGKSGQDNNTKRPARNCRKGANKKVLFDFSMLQLTRRRRSSLCKRARSTVWGLLGNIAQVVEQNGSLDISPNKPKRSRRPKGVQSNRKRQKNLNIRNSKKFKGKTHTPTGPISLKVKFGKESVSAMNFMTSVDQNMEKGSKAETSFHDSLENAQNLLKEEVPGSTRFQCCNGSSRKASDMHLSDKDTRGGQYRNNSDDHPDFRFHVEVDKVGVTIDNRVLDSGTSPDSEVINTVLDAPIVGKDSEELHTGLISSHEFTELRNVSSLSPPWKRNDQERRKDEFHQTGGCSLKGEISSPENLINVQEAKLRERENTGDGSYSSDTSTSTMTGTAPINTSNMEGFSGEHLPSSRAEDFRISEVENQSVSNLPPKLGARLEYPESLISEKLLPVAEGQKLTKCSSSKKVNKSKSETPDSSTRREKNCKKKGNQGKSAGKSKNKEKGDSNQIPLEVDNHHETGNYALSGDREDAETDNQNVSLKEDMFNINVATTEVGEECIKALPPRNAWVSCDVCHKWRRIPAILADRIEETNCRWVCKDNTDIEYANCSIPQEKSNAEINAELEISDASCEEDAHDVCLNSKKSRRKQSTVNEQTWTVIKSNLFLHRRRKTQTIDEIMVCGCKPPLDSRQGCGGKCLNRMLNIECIPGTCPSGELCSNQQFQKRKYAKLKSIACGKKGYGLQLLEDVSEGQFLIEYVGEVLDMHAYKARQRDYAVKGHKHFYFMTLNGSEVIDACAKGNLGRFINHSCDPNCRTEKWMVNGEVCIGIFALRDIKKGEEVTFDYNYVRVFGAAAKKCVCGSSVCRGYIGGDPLNSEVIVQGDSDEEYPEPVMVYEDDEMDQNLKNDMPSVNSPVSNIEVRTVKGPLKIADETDEFLSIGGQAEIFSGEQSRDILYEDKHKNDSSSTVAGCVEMTKESGVSNMSACTALKIGVSEENECLVRQHSPVQLIERSSQSGDVTNGNVSAASKECSATEKTMNASLCSNQGLDTISLNIDRSLHATSGTKKKLKPGTGENKEILSGSHPCTKISVRLSSIKKRKPKIDAVNAKKPLEFDSRAHEVPIRPKRLLEDQSNGHFEAGRYEAVQEKLNELLDPDGGISKRKDASRGYLKLLLLTAASGDSGNGEAIQSNRDLSMILDALLKTKSRKVLVDIINKNGLQMLHNIMKRYRKEFIKIPILRKLLKVLEYLATREILTSEHINGGPRCPGVESFRDSILTLTEHTDKQVHQIARNFRDRWIPRCFRKFGGMDRDDCKMEFSRGPNHDRLSASQNSWTDRAAKPAEMLDCDMKSAAALSAVDAPMLDGSSASHGKRKRKSRWDQPCKETLGGGAEPDMAGAGVNNMHGDVPPGFSSPLNGPVLPSDASSSAINQWKLRTSHPKYPCQMAMGHSQQRFISRISVAYGVPISIVEQFGTQQSGASESWLVAPGMPFQPFPPLPPYPRDQNICTTGQTEQDCHARATFDSSQNPPAASGVAGPNSETSGPMNQLDFQRPRGYNDLGRKYFRQQKWNNSKLAPPWVRMRNGWGSLVNNSRNGIGQPSLGSGPNEFKSSHNAQDNSTWVQNGNTFHQHPRQQN